MRTCTPIWVARSSCTSSVQLRLIVGSAGSSAGDSGSGVVIPRPYSCAFPTAERPERLAELQDLWLSEAQKFNVLPLDDRRIERFDADQAGRPVLVRGDKQLRFGGMGRLTEASLLNTKNKSHAVTAEIEVPDSGVEGVIIAQGGAFAGWSLYVKDGRPRYCYNLLGLQRFIIESTAEIPGGTHQVRMEF